MRISDWSSDVWSSDLGVCVCVCQTWLLTLLRSSCRSREANAHKMPYTTVSSCVITSEKLVPMSCSIARKLGAEQTAKQSQPISDTHAHKRQAIEEHDTNLRAACLYCLSSRSEEHTSELQSLMRISYAVFCLKKKK